MDKHKDELHHYNWDVVGSVGSGAMNAALLSMYNVNETPAAVLELENFWNGLQTERVYTPHSYWNMVKNVGLNTLQPVQDLFREILDTDLDWKEGGDAPKMPHRRKRTVEGHEPDHGPLRQCYAAVSPLWQVSRNVKNL